MKLIQFFFIWLALALLAGCQTPTFPHTIQTDKLSAIDSLVTEEIEKGNFPGAVVLLGQGDKILYHKSFGHEVIEPFIEPMTKDTIFDMASVSKPVGTATSILILWDQGKIDLEDKVGKYLPEFAVNGKENVRLKHLLTHTSGLPAYTNAAELKKQYGEPCPDKVIEKICSFTAMNEPGETYRYSCLGYITLAKIVEVVSGQTIDQFAQENIFKPLKMKHTTYNPPKEWEKDIAATQIFDDHLLRGFVHDPLAQLNAGISGNAGLFTNAHDLSIYCRMVLNGGTYRGVRILSPEAVQLLTRPQWKNRSYGFGVTTSYSWIKGEDTLEKSISHLGYTGTAVVCDPSNHIYLIILTNRVHPNDKGNISPFRTQVAEIISQALVEN
ncbi:MAG: hypothetical protein AMJ79_12095 [Phycisphaerae bacterium SM23_30]|nr:MAG: hypothetical protein AMJ79_12095 [Phycisphaerae bacterium SM23_30]